MKLGAFLTQNRDTVQSLKGKRIKITGNFGGKGFSESSTIESIQSRRDEIRITFQPGVKITIAGESAQVVGAYWLKAFDETNFLVDREGSPAIIPHAIVEVL